jgi:hypothetical protein
MGWIEWALQCVVILLLAVSLPFVLRLERTLAAVRRDRSVLEGSAGNLTEATRMAEAASIRLRAAAEGGGRQLNEALAAAEPLRDDLRYLVERAETLADRLEAAVRVARPLAQEAMQPDPSAAEPGRSQAERALLRALRTGR